MGRGIAILAVFAAVLGAFVVWGPAQTIISPREAEPPAHHSVAVIDAPRPNVAETPNERVTSVTPPRKSDGEPVKSPRRDAVLSAAPKATPATSVIAPQQPTTALAALPERPIAGFPATPCDSLSNDQIAAVIKQARALRAGGQFVPARDLLSELYLGHRTTKEQRLRIAEELDPLSDEILRSHAVLDDGQLYQVEPGDTLVKLARHLKVPPDYIARINHVDPRRLRRGQTLKLVTGPFDVLVETGEFELTVLRHGKYVRRFPIGIGKDDTPTPLGLYTITDKQIDPTKWPDSVDRRTLPPRHPENPLGSRWLGLGLGYGIHGTIEPQTIGQKASRGCIRMRNEHVEELYDMVSESSRVLIR